MHPKTPAAIDGRLKPGDRILKIGDHVLDNLTRDQAMNVLMETPVLVQLTVYRTPSEGGEQKSSKYNHIHCIYKFYTHYYKCSLLRL